MLREQAGTVAVFTWKGDLPSDAAVGADPASRYSDDYGEQWAYQATEPVAAAVLAAVRGLGHATDAGTPYFGEHAWHFVIRLGGREYSVAVQCVLWNGRDDSFAVEPSIRRGCLASLVGPRPPASAVRPACTALQAALAAHPLVADLEWVEDAWEANR